VVREGLRVRELANDDGNRLLRIVRRCSGSVVTWRRAQMVLGSAQDMNLSQIAQVTFASPDRVRDLLHNFNLDGFDALYPRYRGDRPPSFTWPSAERSPSSPYPGPSTMTCRSRPGRSPSWPSSWSLRGWSTITCHEGLRVLLREEGVSLQMIKTWKQSSDPDFEAKKNRILHLYGLMDGTVDAQPGDPDAVVCVDEFGPLKLQPHPGRQWILAGGGGLTPRRRRRAIYTCPHGVRHLLAACDLSRDKLYGHTKPRKRRGEFLVFLRYLRTLYPPRVRLGLVLDNYSPHLSTRDDPRIGQWAAANNVELA
jgi:Winged helix-turn helix